MSSINFFTTGILLCLFVGSIWSATTDDTDDYVPYEGQRYDSFDWNLLKALENPEFGNVLVSPLSIKLVLAMLYEGATGATEKELERILQLPVSRQATRDRFQQILSSLQTSSSEHTLDIGTRVYMDSSIEPLQRFAATLKTFYVTDIKSVDFNNASESINYWASNITHGRVKNLVSEGDLEDAVLLMANALYFKGLWRIPFPRNQTTHGGFYITPSRTVTVPYMYTYGRYYYFESNELDAKILRLPYKGTHMSMFILLPNSKAGLSRLINDISPQVLKRHLWLMDQHYVHVHLPKFAFEFNSKLGRILQKLGLQHIFQNTASLAGIARGKGLPKKLMVSNILQKAGIEINEEGSTVWAATEVALGNKFGTPDVSFNASNPFVFYIEDEFTGSVIFVGKIENPTQIEQLPFPEELKVPTRFAPNPEPESASTPQLVTASTTESQTNQGILNPYPIPSQFITNDLKSERFFYFDIDLLKEVAHAQPQGNFLISPLSIKSTLLMILEGSAGESAAELKSALRLPENSRYYREEFKKLLEEFSKPKNGVSLEIANRVFISDRLKPVPEFRNKLNRYYNSDISTVDFKNGMASATAINSWVYQQTHGLISHLVYSDFFGGDTSILLANALYFKGIWEKSFDEQNTQPRCFYLPNNECYMTPMMDTVNIYKYDEVKELDAQVVELPYTGGEYSMVIVLPNKRHGVQLLVRDIRTSINSIAEKLNETEVLVALPRFKIDYSDDIKEYLQDVHVKKIFSPQAILSGIVDDVSVRVSNFIHKTAIEVNEKGTVAAAASGAVVIPLMGNVKPSFRADHPFLFFIRHIPSGTILFEGRVSEPERAAVNNAVTTPTSSPQYRISTSNGLNGIKTNSFLGQPIQNQNIQRDNFQIRQ
ncbi:Serpin 27A [Carabus blaptoides fortunei]